MCGIVGVAGNLNATDEKIFKEMLLADVVRGKHATGVALVKGKCRKVDTLKLAIPSPLFLDLKCTDKLFTGFINNTVALGHNRHATKGDSDDHAGAHPFTHGHITLVHNGSLTYHANLTPQGENFVVDSEAICRAIELYGIEEVAPKLTGAFALVWIDSEKDTLNFLRNGERRLGLLFDNKLDKVWWSSEIELAKWQLARGDDLFTRNSVSYDEELELPVGEWISIPITHIGIDLSNKVITKLPIKEPVRYQNYSYSAPYDYNRGYQAPTSQAALPHLVNKVGEAVSKHEFGGTREDALKKLTTGIVEEKGRCNIFVRGFVAAVDTKVNAAILDERIGFFITDFKPYSVNNPIVDESQGIMHGEMIEFPFCKVLIYGCSYTEFKKMCKETKGVAASYLMNITTPTGFSARVINGLLEEDKLEDMIITLRKDSVLPADPEVFHSDIGREVTLASEVSEEEPEELDYFLFPDGTYAVEGGTAIYRGASPVLVRNQRYSIADLTVDANEELISVMLLSSGTRVKVGAVNCFEGRLPEGYNPVKLQDYSGKNLSVAQWKEATQMGCCNCGEVPSISVADQLEWIHDNSFLCGPCNFDQSNVGL